MKIVYFAHSVVSCWNHGNAHFVRGVLRALVQAGHDVVACEQQGAWSLANLLRDHGSAGLEAYEEAYPDLRMKRFATHDEACMLCDDAELVIVHEWNDPALVSVLGLLRRHAPFTLLFHDTHHRAVSEPEAIEAFDLSGYDGVLAFGETLAAVYRRRGWGERVWVWHEAADVTHFHPPSHELERSGYVWIGNWGDGERAIELEEFLLRPAEDTGLPLDVFGVRYPDEARAMLSRHGARYRGWLPNAQAPDVFARHLATVHVPRRFYVTLLPGIPTIRMFEALACGIPLVSAPWEDCEHLFRAGSDYLTARNGEEMGRQLAAIRDDAGLRAHLSQQGLKTILARHTCAHRAAELTRIVDSLRMTMPETV